MEAAMTQRLSALLRDLAVTPRGEHPVLSIYLDLSVDNTGQRKAFAPLDQELARCSAELEERGPRRDNFEADRARLAAYLAVELPSDARGVAIFASEGAGLWQPIPLLVPVETYIACDTMPHLFQLARVIEDNETYVVAVAEGQQAQLYLFSPETLEQIGATEARENLNRVQAGGWSQLRYERHNGYVVQLHMNDLAAALQEAVDSHGARHIVIMTNDSIKGHVRAALSPQLQELVVDMVNFDRGADAEQLAASLAPLRLEVEHKEEEELVGRLEDQLATKGGLAFAGDKDVAMGLLKGQVDTLLISPGYGGPGGECPTCGALRLGQREKCPYDGSELVPVEMREALVMGTLRQGGSVEIIGLEGALEAHGGVAAILRYRDDVAGEVGGKIVGDGIA
jgi:peptide chain release factor subunit 1